MTRSFHRPLGPCIVSLLLLGACSGGDERSESRLDPPPEGDFSIVLGTSGNNSVGTLIEGATDPLVIPVSLLRQSGHRRPVTLSVSDEQAGDGGELTVEIGDATLEDGESASDVRVRLGVSAQPIAAGTRRLMFVADDGVDRDRISIDVQVQPTDSPDVYLLIGQSNMVGFSGEGTRQAEPGGPDAVDPRVRQLNVTGNDANTGFTEAVDFTTPARNVGVPSMVVAEDPLHVMADEDGGKDEQYIGLGLSFAKRALGDTSAQVLLVPAAWSGSSFCANENGPQGNWNVGSDDPALGNDLLFQRAVLRADLALRESGGILRGILWHQGESDANEVCAPLYAANLDRLAGALRTRIRVDARGPQARGVDADIPFVVGTLSRGDDPRGEFSVFSDAREQVDQAIRLTPQRLSYSATSLHDDLVPANGFACGAGDCVHFGAEALREMGVRYYSALRDAATNPLP